MATPHIIELQINGKFEQVDAALYPTLLLALREGLLLTGTKYGCGEGECGACTVLIDGKARRSCQVATSDASGKAIVTIEGLAENNILHAAQQAFMDEGAMQCGYCTPGMIMSTVAMLNENPRPDQDEVLEKMNGNICRCSNYPRILAAIQRIINA